MHLNKVAYLGMVSNKLILIIKISDIVSTRISGIYINLVWLMSNTGKTTSKCMDNDHFKSL